MIFGRHLNSVARLLAAMLLLAAALAPAAARANVTVVAFGLFGGQSVFESEAKGAASILARRLAAEHVIVRFNTKTRGAVSVASLAATLQSAAARMDRDHDVLVLLLTSHGSPDGLAVVAPRREETLAPGELARMLERTGVRHRVVIVSACYSGVFVPPLANDDTLVITAADARHSSFGCQDKVQWTYFGDAFFNRALRRAPDLRSAFAEARDLVSRRERRSGLVHSNPQIAGGRNIDALLATRPAAR